jgi:hypothetical protein
LSSTYLTSTRIRSVTELVLEQRFHVGAKVAAGERRYGGAGRRAARHRGPRFALSSLSLRGLKLRLHRLEVAIAPVEVVFGALTALLFSFKLARNCFSIRSA